MELGAARPRARNDRSHLCGCGPLGTARCGIAEYRAALERHGIDTGPWWERQLGLSLLGIMVLLGWEKALGPPDDLVWWERRVLEGAELLA